MGKSEAWRREHPIRSGEHTVEEFAQLWAQGLRYAQIAERWGMRPIAGKDDLRYEIEGAWERAGCPFGERRPFGKWERGAWARWSESMRRAIPLWLHQMASDGRGWVDYRAAAALMGG